jgi:aclacinomycin oxidase
VRALTTSPVGDRRVVSAVEDAVREGRRLAVGSGHCLEGFVSDPDVRVIIDVRP